MSEQEKASGADPASRPAAADLLIASLGLTPHPEGGFYRELYRSSQRVQPVDGRPERAALTTIYFLLEAGAISRWHRVTSDEVWHYYDGAPLELFTADADVQHVRRHIVGGVHAGLSPEHVVPAGVWQAARSTGAYTLVGCVVGPGFTFDDFQMLKDLPELAAVAAVSPDAAPFV